MKNLNISVQELQRLLTEKKPVYILDVRPQEQREEWHIAESFHIDAYGPLNKGDQTVLDDLEIPENTPVVTVCAAGRTSLLAAEALSKKGYQAYSLEGGMKAWNYAWDTAEFTLTDSLTTVVQVKRVAKGCLSYIVGSGNEAIVIDASLDPDVYLNIAQSKGWTIRYVMDTHIHADYLSRTKELAEATGAQHFFIEGADVEYPFTPVKDQQEISFGESILKILHTPGHTTESTSYFINEEALFTGDTLFTDGVGRPDLKANREEATRKAENLFESLQQVLSLPANTLVLPAHISGVVTFDSKMIHGKLSELRNKLELLQLPKEAFVEASLSRIPPTPPNYLTIATINKNGNFEGYTPADLEAGANRCAVA